MNRLRTATLSILITLAFAAANSVLAQDKVGTRAIAGDNATPPNTTPAKATVNPATDPTAPLPPGVYWFAFVMDFQGLEPADLSAKRKKHLESGGLALGTLSASSGQPPLWGSMINGNSNNPKMRQKFAAHLRDNARISREQYAKYFSAMVGEGGVLVARGEIDKDGICWALDEDPVLLSDSASAALGEKQEDEHKRVYKLLAAKPAPRVPGQTKPTVAAPSTSTPGTAATSGNGAQK